MNIEGNTSTVSYYAYSSVYWMSITFDLLGIFLNAIFVYILTKENERNQQADYSLSLTCYVQIVSAVKIIVKNTFVFSSRGSLMRWWNVFDTMTFMLRGIYICLFISLNMTRFIVMKNIQHVPNYHFRMHISRTFRWLLPLVTVLASIAYGLLSLLDLSNLSIQYTFHSIFIGLPWGIFVLLNFTMIIVTLSLTVKRNKRNQVSVLRRRIGVASQTWVAQPDIANRLIQQVIYSLMFQTFCLAIPHTYIVVLDFMTINKHAIEQDAFNSIILSMISPLNPIALGLFLKQRREDLAHLLSISRSAERISHANVDSLEHIPENTRVMNEHDIRPSTQSIGKDRSTVMPISIFYVKSPKSPINVNDNQNSRLLENVEGNVGDYSDRSNACILSSANGNISPVISIPEVLNSGRSTRLSYHRGNISRLSDYSSVSEASDALGKNAWMASRRNNNCLPRRTPGYLSNTNSSASIMSVASMIQDTISYFDKNVI